MNHSCEPNCETQKVKWLKKTLEGCSGNVTWFNRYWFFFKSYSSGQWMASLELGFSPPRLSLQELSWHLITSSRDMGTVLPHFISFIIFTSIKSGYALFFLWWFYPNLIFCNSKEAQKCFCGTPSCRGFLGGENRVSVRAAGGKMKKDRRKSALTTVSFFSYKSISHSHLKIDLLHPTVLCECCGDIKGESRLFYLWDAFGSNKPQNTGLFVSVIWCSGKRWTGCDTLLGVANN